VCNMFETNELFSSEYQLSRFSIVFSPWDHIQYGLRASISNRERLNHMLCNGWFYAIRIFNFYLFRCTILPFMWVVRVQFITKLWLNDFFYSCSRFRKMKNFSWQRFSNIFTKFKCSSLKSLFLKNVGIFAINVFYFN
jgi:hypothetical protein